MSLIEDVEKLGAAAMRQGVCGNGMGVRTNHHASGDARKRYGDQSATATRQGTRGSGTGIKALLPRVRGRTGTVWESGLSTTRQGTRGNGMGIRAKHHASGDAR